MNKRKKNTRLRGSKTHTHGSMKKRRGAGHRGGRGAAGSGKRADTKKPSIWKGRYFGGHGFSSLAKRKIAINVSLLDQTVENLVKKKMASKEGDSYTVDLTKLGYHKLLGNGKLTKKLNINVAYASEKSIKIVEKSGGQVTVLKNKE